jgi:nucleoside-diphosphate-sugar epimerase
MAATTSYCHVREVGRAHLAAYEKGKVCENYLLGGPNTSQIALASAVARAAGSAPPKYEVPWPLLKVIAAAVEFVGNIRDREPVLTRGLVDTLSHCWFVDSSKAVRELGYEMPSVDEIAADIVSWMRRTGILEPPGSPGSAH